MVRRPRLARILLGVVTVLAMAVPGALVAVVAAPSVVQAAAPPTVSRVAPSSGPVAGGTAVTVSGTGFTGASKVTFGKYLATNLVVRSATRLTVSAPAASRAGTVDVKVSTPSGTSAVVSADAYTYSTPPAPPAPAVTGLTPTSGPTAGGTTVTVTGTGFTGATKVTFGSATATNLVVGSATQLTASAPAAAGAGVVDVRVTTPNGISPAVAADQYTYATPGITDHCGTISGAQTWAAGTVHRLTCNVNVPAGTSLTVSAGAVVKAKKFGLSIAGTLDVQGSSTEPAVLTSLADDSRGGDTNNDGSSSTPAAGDWGGITASSGSTLRIAGATILYATTVTTGGANAVQITGSTLSHASYTCLTVKGKNFSGNPATALVKVSGTTVSDCASAGIVVDTTGYPSGLSPTVQGNAVSAVVYRAIRVGGADLDGALLTGNSASGTTGTTAMTIVGTLTGDFDVTATSIPLVIGDLTVAPSTTMRVGAGAVIKSDYGELHVDGNLNIAGTSSSPAVFTSIKDDTRGGDIDHDGYTSAFNGDWSGISADTHAVLDIDHAVVDYSEFGISAHNTTTCIITNSQVYNAQYDGIFVDVDRTHEISGSATVDLRSNTVVAGYYANTDITVWVVGDNSNPVTAAPAPVVMDNDASCDVSSFEDEGLPVYSCSGVYVHSTNLDFTKLTGNQFSGSDHSNLYISGNVIHNSMISSSLSDVSGGDVEVAPGSTLTTTGVTLQAFNLTIDGSLVVRSTRFTIRYDNECCPPHAGEWSGITANPGSSVSVDDSYIGFADVGISASGSAIVTVTDSTIEASASAGIQIDGATVPPVITGNEIDSYNPYIDEFDGENAVQISNSSINLARLTGNTGNVDHIDGLTLTNDTQAVSATAALPAVSGALVPVLTGCGPGLTIPSGVALTLQAGSVVKADCSRIQVDGSLRTTGSSSQPAVLTSLKDDTVGGDTNSDGSATTPQPGDWSGIGVGSGGTVKLAPSTQVKYG